jgi:hypothetical protein
VAEVVQGIIIGLGSGGPARFFFSTLIFLNVLKFIFLICMETCVVIIGVGVCLGRFWVLMWCLVGGAGVNVVVKKLDVKMSMSKFLIGGGVL